jgi:hypothetical protein
MDITLWIALVCLGAISFLYFKMLQNVKSEIKTRNILILIPAFLFPRKYLSDKGYRYWKYSIMIYIGFFVLAYIIQNI